MNGFLQGPSCRGLVLFYNWTLETVGNYTVGMRIKWFSVLLRVFNLSPLPLLYLPSKYVPEFMPMLDANIFKPTTLALNPELCSKLMASLSYWFQTWLQSQNK